MGAAASPACSPGFSRAGASMMCVCANEAQAGLGRARCVRYVFCYNVSAINANCTLSWLQIVTMSSSRLNVGYSAFLVTLALAHGEEACDFGPTHHSHLVLPLAESAGQCKQRSSPFFLSHGATFFCPHTFDVKLLGTIVEDDARAALCDDHFKSVAAGQSPKHVLRPTLPAGGLPALGRGEMSSWTSPVMYHVHNFGKDNDSGPDKGWNVTVIRNETTTINVVRVLYGRRLEMQPRPAALTYLAHSAHGAAGKAVLSHYISTSGASGFDHILTAGLSAAHGADPVTLRADWPTFLTINYRNDDFRWRLKTGDDVDGELHVYDAHGLPTTTKVRVKVSLDYYAGTSDGFAGFGTMCPMKAPAPQSPTTCFLA